MKEFLINHGGMSNKTVSIIIPCYNQAHFLCDAIDSALDQTYKDIEIIVVNDGSQDNTLSTAGSYDVRIVNQVNKGLPASRNVGIKIATGKYIVTLDADDKIHPEFVEKCLKQIEQYDVVSTWLHTFGNENRNWGSDLDEPKYEHFIKRNEINCCSMFKREMWQDLKGYDETMREGFEDWEFWIRASMEGYRFKIIHEHLFYYRKHSVSMFKEANMKRDRLIEGMKARRSTTGQIIDVVYVLGKGSQNNDNELRFSLRSLSKYCTGWRNVWVIGEKPSWLVNVNHIPMKDIGPIKVLNILEKIKTACKQDGLSEEFLFMNDDHFFCDRGDVAKYPYYYDNEERTKIQDNRSNMDNYNRIISATMERWPNAKYFDIHKPIRYDKKKFIEMCDNIDFKRPELGYLIKTTYCAYHSIKGTKGHDTIFRGRMTLDEIEEATVFTDQFSIHDEAVNRDLIKYFETHYPIKSQFEK